MDEQETDGTSGALSYPEAPTTHSVASARDLAMLQGQMKLICKWVHIILKSWSYFITCIYK